jgi:phenylpyruvate tautomerase PptA (4-oxalocrotonate tautomerase family)
MPIIDVEIVSDRQEALQARVTQALADELGAAFGAAPGKVWVKVRSLPFAQYAENGGKSPMPVFVTITASAPPAGEELRERVTRITDAVARITRRPSENIHVEFLPAARGRIAFGGKLVE